MGELLEIGDYRLLAAQRAIARLIADMKAAPEVDGLDHRPLALAALEVAAMAIEATVDEGFWFLPEAAILMGDALAEEAELGPEDGSNTIWVPAKALARAGSVDDYSHPDPDFGLVADAISEVVQRSTGDETGRNGPWTAPTFWQTNAHDQSQADVILKVAPIVAEVAADLALGRPMTRNPLDAIRAVI